MLEGGAGGGGDGGYVYGPGQRNTVYILDVDGTPLVFDTMYMPTATAADKAELQGYMKNLIVHEGVGDNPVAATP